MMDLGTRLTLTFSASAPVWFIPIYIHNPHYQSIFEFVNEYLLHDDTKPTSVRNKPGPGYMYIISYYFQHFLHLILGDPLCVGLYLTSFGGRVGRILRLFTVSLAFFPQNISKGGYLTKQDFRGIVSLYKALSSDTIEYTVEFCKQKSCNPHPGC